MSRPSSAGTMIRYIFVLLLLVDAQAGWEQDLKAKINEKRRQNHNAVNRCYDNEDGESWAAVVGSGFANALPGVGGAVAGLVGDPALLVGWMVRLQVQYSSAVNIFDDLTHVLHEAGVAFKCNSGQTPGGFLASGMDCGQQLLKEMRKSGDIYHQLEGRVGKILLRMVIFGIVKCMGREQVRRSLGASRFFRSAESAVIDHYRAMEGIVIISGNDAATRAIHAAEAIRLAEERAAQGLELDEAGRLAERWATERALEASPLSWLPILGQAICGGLSAALMRQSTVELNQQFMYGYHSSIDTFWDMVIDKAIN